MNQGKVGAAFRWDIGGEQHPTLYPDAPLNCSVIRTSDKAQLCFSRGMSLGRKRVAQEPATPCDTVLIDTRYYRFSMIFKGWG